MIIVWVGERSEKKVSISLVFFSFLNEKNFNFFPLKTKNLALNDHHHYSLFISKKKEENRNKHSKHWLENDSSFPVFDKARIIHHFSFWFFDSLTFHFYPNHHHVQTSIKVTKMFDFLSFHCLCEIFALVSVNFSLNKINQMKYFFIHSFWLEHFQQWNEKKI